MILSESGSQQSRSPGPLPSWSPYLRMAVAMVPRLKFDVHIWQRRVQCNYTSLIKTHRTYQWALTGTRWLPSQAGEVSLSQPMGRPPFPFDVHATTLERRLSPAGETVNTRPRSTPACGKEKPGGVGKAAASWIPASTFPTNPWKFPRLLSGF